jgi:tRNA A-37 threonylcarbamoyl transferase component Bud32
VEGLPAYVGGYQVLAEVGRSGMGVVYKARHTGLGRLAAVKMLLSGRYATAEDQIRFQIEAEALARLRHPDVVQVFEAGRHDGRPFLALEWVDGGTLERLVRGPALSPVVAAGLAERVARAVHFAHTCGVLHRDLKPANVLLAADGAPKVSDFGLAKLVDGAGAGRDGPTATGWVLGTPSYVAPEQARGGAPAGAAADTYGAGAILFALLTGRPPFDGPSAPTVLRAVMDEAAPSVRRLRPGVPRDLATICERCLEKDPRKRYATTADLADDLRRWREGRPIAARPVPAWERAWLAARRPFAAAMAATALLALAAGGGVAGWQWREAVRARDSAERREGEAVAARALAEQREGEAVAARRLAELREARRAVEKGLLLCDRWDVVLGLEWLERGRQGAETAGDADMAAVARANLAAWSARVPAAGATASRADLTRLPGFPRPPMPSAIAGAESTWRPPGKTSRLSCGGRTTCGWWRS